MTTSPQSSRLDASSVTEPLLPVIFLIFLLLYTFTLSRVLSASGDSVAYINAIDSGAGLFHPHHLLYNAVGWLWIALLRSFGIEGDTAVLVSGLNAIFGALSLCVFYGMLRGRFKIERFPALLGTCLPAFSFGFWFYSGAVEVYIIALFFLLLSFSLLTCERITATTCLLVGFTNGMAVLFHQMHVLFALVVFFAVLCAHRRGDITVWKAFGYYLLTAIPTVVIPYSLVVLTADQLKSPADMWSWVTLYLHEPRYWSPLAIGTLVRVGIGLARAFVGSHFLFAIPSIQSLAERTLPGHYLADEAYLVRNLGEVTGYWLLALSIVLLLVLVASAVAQLRYWSSLSLRHREVVYALLLWILAYGSLVFFFVPDNVELWIPQSVCFWIVWLILLLVINREKSGRYTRIGLAGAVVLLFSINFTGSIRFTRDRANDYYYSKIAPILELAKEDDLVVIGRSWILEDYLRRYGTARVLSLSSIYDSFGASSQSIQQVRSAIDDTLARGRSVFISGEAVEPERATIHDYGSGIAVFDSVWDAYRQRWSMKKFTSNAVYVLR